MAQAPLAKAAYGDSDGKVKVLQDNIQDCMKANSNNLIVNFGPVFGKLNAETMSTLDGNLKIAIAGTTKQIAGIPPELRTYGSVINCCSKSPLLEADGTGISRADSLLKKDVTAFKFDGSPDAAIVKEVNAWFQKLIGDDDILASTSVDLSVLAHVVAQSGATVDSTEAFFHKVDREEKSLDIAGIRYPDPDKPFIRVFRIHLSAWSKGDRTLYYQEDNNGIIGEVNVAQYKPRASVIDTLTGGARDNALAAAEKFWG